MNFITASYSSLHVIFDGARDRCSNLKKIIYKVKKDLVASKDDIESGLLIQSQEPNETTSLLLPNTRANAKAHVNINTSSPSIGVELDNVVSFYYKKEKEIYAEVEALVSDIQNVEHIFYCRADTLLNGHRRSSTGGDSTKRTRSRWDNRASRRSLQVRSGSWGHDAALALANEEDDGKSLWFESEVEEDGMHFRHRCIEIFIKLSELQAYVKLNSTGSSMALKKYDKSSENDTKTIDMNRVIFQAYPFLSETTAKLQQQIDHVTGIYARIFAGGDLELAKRSLGTYLEDHIFWKRNTIWRDMIEAERKSQAVSVGPLPVLQEEPVPLRTQSDLIVLPKYFTGNVLLMAFCCCIFIALLNVSLFDEPEQQNCFAILIFASLLWATEAMPLFVTSLLVPLLVAMLRVMRDDGEDHIRLDAQAATKKIFSLMFSPVIMLLLGGFAVAAAMRKFHIAKAMATVVLSRAGTRPSAVLLAHMLVATVASMWISNVAAPVLCFSLIQPILRTLPPGSPFAKCLILGIALASNVGGMASPISSPQNIIAIEYMSPAPSWLEWFLVALPVCLACDLAIWGLLLQVYRPSNSTPTISIIRSTKDPITKTQIFVCSITAITIVLWCFEHHLEWLFGDMGLIAVIPLLAFFGTGILTKEDFNNFLWTVIILAMGGIALGKAVESSGLLHIIAMGVQDYVKDMSVFMVCCVFAILVLVVTTFISHTVGALIILPIVAQVGATLPDPHPRLLVMSAALMCSGAMGLPVSGFPNMNAIMMEDEMGQPYLSTGDFLKVGVPSSVVACVTVVTLGYTLMTLSGW
ncbi:Sodium:sulfate symporter transmembrane region-domain-containing protein [Gamsiella multidivaricata]|uniref:Sodium:sulfate symporter transmembrane region-domain-containing protein n=1 Tax=Gamsiella multidivaricata TaxID=101098 RepID=UPI002220F235|nr:Sodium:sulfate symporter transmembrane region-domain-containing protein [Gamsiella multidivaricata]KAG0370560.1 low-affinity phosphate transporter [Gamsiella multidivaricata]KAI7818299.1 Sodium:sulfate symporter transmembrane region-domain-containing protein [Gamsiella multidivaricata]